MNENAVSKNLNSDLLYALEVRIPDQLPKKLEVVEQIFAGVDPRNDLILIDPKIKAKHFMFRKKNNILTVQYLGNTGDTFLNGLPLEQEKSYILEKNDVLKVGKIGIIIRSFARISKPTPTTWPETQTIPIKIDELADFNEKKESAPILAPIEKKMKAGVQKKGPIFNFTTINLIPYKIYGFVVDIALTYLLLSFVLPNMGLLSITQNYLYPISEFVSQFMITHQSSIAPMKILSIIEFFICFHALMIIASLILGTTPGAFLIGLHHKDNNKSILALRFKAYIYALLNIIVLPLIFFDIPLYRGRNLKELLTFSEREITSSLIFKILRRAVTPILTIACFLSPFFLSPPYTANITKETTFTSKYMDVHATNISSSSGYLGFSLNSSLNSQYALLPYFEQNKIGLVLYDLKNNKSLMMREHNRLNLSQALFKLRYANPFASLNIPNNLINSEALKNKSLESLNLTLTTLLPGLFEFGPMLANRFLFKEQFLKNFKAQDNFLLNSFEQKNPALLISASGKEEKVFLFGRKEIIEFTLTGAKEPKLLENFSSAVLDGLRYDQSSSNDGLKNPQILEVLEAFERSNYLTILTYYINEAKKVHNLENPDWRAFFRRNVLQTKQVLMEDKTRVGINKNIERSFNDIINLL